MSALHIIVTDISSADGSVFVSGKAFSQFNQTVNADGESLQGSAGPTIDWVATVGWGDSAATINTAIKNAAIAAATASGYTVGGGDKKTLFRGALDL